MRDKHLSCLVPTTEDKPDIESVAGELVHDELCDESSSYSSCSTESGYSSHLNSDSHYDHGFSQRLIEIALMSDEDLFSFEFRELHQRAIQAEKHKLERDQMQKEDLLSRKSRTNSKRLAETKQSKSKTTHTKKERKSVCSRDSRAKDQIQKAANRIKIAREQKEQQSRAKVTLPPMSSKPKKRTGKKIHRPILHDVVNNEPKSKIHDLPRTVRRQKLVNRRHKRLQSQAVAAKEALAIRQRQVIAEQEAETMRKRLEQIKCDEEQNAKKEAHRLRFMRKSAELERMEEELRLANSRTWGDQNEENKKQFRDVKHWTKSLSGIS